MDPQSISRFVSCFKTAFRSAVQRHGSDLQILGDIYDDASLWTKFMLTENVDGGQQSVIRTTVQAFLGVEPRQMPSTSWYTLDAVGTVDVSLPHSKWKSIPGESLPYWSKMLCVAVEHENDKDLETEMWKLVHFRVPLKVLIFYDFSETDEKRARPYRADPTVGELATGRQWLEAKLHLLGDIVAAAQGKLSKEDSDYIIIVGSWQYTPPSGVRWTYFSWHWGDMEFRELMQARDATHY